LLADRKYLGLEDCEQVVRQLFPTEPKDLVQPECFDIFITGLGVEGIISSREARSISRPGVSIKEFEGGVHWDGHRCIASSRYDPSVLVMFNLPKQAHCSTTTLSAHLLTNTQTELYFYLRILAEAATYDQKFWKGYFLPNARSKLGSFHEAYLLQKQGLPTPPHLADYKRPWTYRETRLLTRGHLICTLLDVFDKGELTDFDIIRAIRGSFIHIPSQGYWDVEDLSTFLYHRVIDSGLPISHIPDILILHPEHDAACARVGRRVRISKALEEQANVF
jgi:hypothetical protein